MKDWHTIYDNLITPENIFTSYQEFKVDKKKTRELLAYERNLEDNLFALYKQLKDRVYEPGKYVGFYINDPKVRLIHKATFVDRIVHHILSRGLEDIFDPTFIYHSYACRKNKGTHEGVRNLQVMARKVSRNNTRVCFALKCDIKKFFSSVNHDILLQLLSKRIKDKDYLSILTKIIKSFHSDNNPHRGLPIGNLTSQYFANIYMNEFDQFMKHTLKVRHYLRYTDDFVILSDRKNYLRKLLDPIQNFLKKKLDVELHPNKIKFCELSTGIDFLGYIVYPYHTLPRYKTKKRLLRKIKGKVESYKRQEISLEALIQTIQSYLGYLSHSNSFAIQKELLKYIASVVPEIWYKLKVQKNRALRAKNPRKKIPKAPSTQTTKNL